MLIGNDDRIRCPYCGTPKELLSLISGNTIGAEYWSDNKTDAPMLTEASPVQKCPNCGKYYFKYKQRHETSENCKGESGNLTYKEWKEAYRQFSIEKIDFEDMTRVRRWVIHAFNDCYYRTEFASVPPEEEESFIEGIIMDSIATCDWNGQPNLLLKAELFREANRMDLCAETLASIPLSELDDSQKRIHAAIKTRMEKGDRKVFLLNEVW